MSARDMRNLEGFPVQWEAFLVLRSLHAMSTNTVPDDLLTWFSTDEYRATLPIYFAAIVTQITKSYVIGITFSELAWWWLGAIGVFLFTRNHSSTSVAYFAGLLTCFSPLGVGHIGSGHLHTASSLSLSVFLAIIWRVFYDTYYSIFIASLLFGGGLYLSSITYTYQWFLIPYFLILSLFNYNRERNFSICILGTVIFLIIRFSSYGLLGLGDLFVHSHQNDPIRVLFSRAEEVNSDRNFSDIFSGLISLFLAKLLIVYKLYKTSYSGVIMSLAAIGAVFVRSNHERLVLASGIALSVAFGAIYGIPWVIMCGYPMVYALASRGICHIHRLTLATIPTGPLHVLKFPAVIFFTQLLLCFCVGLLTNMDIFGDASFSIIWWQGWYEPH